MLAQSPALPFIDASLRRRVEQFVSQLRRRAWVIREARDLTDFASHPCAILSDGVEPVFVKLNTAAQGLDQSEVELASLRWVSEHTRVLTPTPLGLLPVEGGALLILEAVQAVERTAEHWRQIGRTLARLHQHTAACFGLDRHGYFGPLYQDNRPLPDWPTFFAERRLRPGLRLAIASGNIPATVARQVEALIARLPELCGPAVVPALLHGDAQQNNFITTDHGVRLIDPALYYGHPEMDLACVDFFEAVPAEVLEGYQAERAIDPGFWERRELWRMWGYLGVVTVGGMDGYLDRLVAAIEMYR